jgi:hypothetical protein
MRIKSRPACIDCFEQIEKHKKKINETPFLQNLNRNNFRYLTEERDIYRGIEYITTWHPVPLSFIENGRLPSIDINQSHIAHLNRHTVYVECNGKLLGMLKAKI